MKKYVENESNADQPDEPILGAIRMISPSRSTGIGQTAFRRSFYPVMSRHPSLGPQTRAKANTVIEVLKRRVHSEMRAYETPSEPGNSIVDPLSHQTKVRDVSF